MLAIIYTTGLDSKRLKDVKLELFLLYRTLGFMQIPDFFVSLLKL